MEGEMDPRHEGNNFGFEEVYPPVSSTTDDDDNDDILGNDDAEDDLYSGGDVDHNQASEPNTEDLLNFDSPAKPAARASTPPRMDHFLEADTSSDTKPQPPEEPVPAKKEQTPTPTASFCSLFGDKQNGTCCPWLENIDPRVVDLIYWRDVKKSGVVFGSAMITLLALAFFSVVSVLAYLGLAIMVVTLSFRVYKNVLGAVQKSQDGHPFKPYLEMDLALPEERVHQCVDKILSHTTSLVVATRRLFLVEDLVDSIKFALLLWVFTYVGAWFNGLTLIILSTVAVFTMPKVYQTHKTQIDAYLELALSHVKKVYDQVRSKIPLPGKKKQQ